MRLYGTLLVTPVSCSENTYNTILVSCSENTYNTIKVTPV